MSDIHHNGQTAMSSCPDEPAATRRRTVLGRTALGVLGMLTLPQAWVTPVVRSVALPAHAQTTGGDPNGPEPFLATVIVDSENNCDTNPILLDIPAGNFNVAVISGAWNAWTAVTGCDGNGANCTLGWLTAFHLVVDGNDIIVGVAGTAGRWETPQLAIANTTSSHNFSVNDPTTLSFYSETVATDCTNNVGSLTIQVAEFL